MPIKLEVVTAERIVFSDDVDIVTALGAEGQMGILPHHSPLMTTLQPGELVIRKGSDQYILAISGGFLEIRPDHIIVLADTAERSEEIDITRAQAARQKAEDRLHEAGAVDKAQAEAALTRAITRLKVAEKRKKRS